MSEDIDIIRALAEVQRKLSPKYHGKDIIRIRCYVDFEGHGIASETWEEHWELELPFEQYYWMSTTGWKPGKEGVKQSFHGKTFGSVTRQAVAFLDEVKDA